MTPEEIPFNVFRQFYLTTARGLDDNFDENTEELLGELGSWIFNGGIWVGPDGTISEEDEEGYLETMKVVYDEALLYFLEEHSINETDMYIYMRNENEKSGSNATATEKELVMAVYLAEQLTLYMDDFIEYDDSKHNGIVKFQALWRGHNCRWKNPFFTFTD